MDGTPLAPRFLDIAGDADAVRAGVDALSAKEIKDELKHFGVAIAGKKDQIVERLVELLLTVRASPRPANAVDANPARRLFIRRFFPSSFIREPSLLVIRPFPCRPRPPGRTSSPRCERER